MEERTLREAADAKVKVFRKKLRGLKGENGAGNDPEAAKEEEATSGNCVGSKSQTNSINGKEPKGLDISPVVNPMLGVEGEDSKATLVVAPIVPGPGVPVQRETSTGNGNPNDHSKPAGSTGVNAAAGNQGINKTPPRGNVVAQKGQKAAQKWTPTSPVPKREPGSSSDSAARAAAAVAARIPIPGRGNAMQRNASTSSLPIGHPSSNPPVNNTNKDSSSVQSATNFDPLRPTSQPVSSHGGLPYSNSGTSVHSLSQAPIYMMNQHTMAVPALSVPASAVEGGADLMEFQSQPVMQLAAQLQQGNGGSSNQNYQVSLQHTQGSGSYDDVQQPMLLVSHHQFAGMQQPHMMTIQQPVLQFHQGGGGPQESGWVQPMSDPNQWTHQQHGQPVVMVSSQQPGTMAANTPQPGPQSSQPNANSGAAPQSAGMDQNSDPFDELVSRRPPTNNSQQQQQHQQQQPM